VVKSPLVTRLAAWAEPQKAKEAAAAMANKDMRIELLPAVTDGAGANRHRRHDGSTYYHRAI